MSFLVTDVDEPVANVVDTGGIPPADELALRLGWHGMQGDYRIVNATVEFTPEARIKLWVKRQDGECPRCGGPR